MKNDVKIFCETLAWAACAAGVIAFGVEWFRPGYVDAYIPLYIPWVVSAAAAVAARITNE